MTHHEAHGQGQMPNPVQVQKLLRGIDYPTDKRTLLDTARREGADENVLRALERLPETTFNSPNDVSEQMSKLM
ncbi:DUF2795 domain-containing protein [Thermomicrobiaceae bacterium CFH 74404]|uniref:DUF2795 domain-containing protein n=1 Tax=Thermalbibacter longus TaxID=2951981 RepID=A0AA41WH16_9BACT|nr:DUF2795 domain-containing protein [Thermalbibacter longus]MCM8749271.1 DUF2795 domain-containing protein [Thermalbibacter longus]